MRHLKLARLNRATSPASWDDVYSAEIIRRIRKRYSVDHELSILRQRDTKPAEFAEYNEYVEKCKAEVKGIMDTAEADN